MPVSFLSLSQRERYCRYPDALSSDELARFFHLDDDDREWIAVRELDIRGFQNIPLRLGHLCEDMTVLPRIFTWIIRKRM